MIKPGYFIARYKDRDVYIAYDEFYEFSDTSKEKMKQDVRNKICTLSCACRENGEELIITSNDVIRVAENGNQDNHDPSCPKNEYYATWNLLHGTGVSVQDGMVTLRLNLPAMYKKEKPEEEQEVIEKKEKDTNKEKQEKKESIPIIQLDGIFSILNSMAITKESYSIKKQIGIAAQEGKRAEWNYKPFKELKKLMWGVSDEICCLRSSTQSFTLRDLSYNRDLFYQNESRQWFSYAEIEKISYKSGRKYQYVTVIGQPSDKSNYKSVIRIDDEQFNKTFVKTKMFDTEKEELKVPKGAVVVLVSYIRHNMYQKNDEEKQSWQTALKSSVIVCEETTGALARTPLEINVFKKLAENKIVFEIPIEAYIIGNDYTLRPTLAIKRKNKKDILIYLATSKQDYETKQIIKMVESPYTILIYPRAYEADKIIKEIKDILYSK